MELSDLDALRSVVNAENKAGLAAAYKRLVVSDRCSVLLGGGDHVHGCR